MALQEFKCPNCGGAVQYNPGTRELACPFCDSVIDMDALAMMDEELDSYREPESVKYGYEGDGWSEGEQRGFSVYSCKSCGGEIICEETLGATVCPFCDNTIVMTSKFAGTLRPEIIIPFKLGKDAALRSLENHYTGKRLLPAVFKDKNHLEDVKGVYIPFWLFDADADAHMEYHATKTRRWSDSRYHYTEVSTFRVVRDGSIGFNHVPVDGSRSVDNTLTESIEPYSLDDADRFQTSYLAGYYANKYDVDADESSIRANERIRNSTSAAFAATVTGYDSVTPKSTNIRLKKGVIHYALFPVWLLNTSWQDRGFLFAMNGQTGKFVGDLPLDKALYYKWIAKIFRIVAAALLLITQIFLTFYRTA